MSATNDSSQESDATTSGKKANRSPVERAIVWGMIGVLLVVVGIEAHGRLGYSSTLNALRAVVKQSEQEAAYLTLSKARESIAGFPSEVVLEPGPFEGTIRLSWFSLLKSYEVDLIIEPGSEDPMFLGYTTPDAPQEQYGTSESASHLVDSVAADAVPRGFPGSPPGMSDAPFAPGGDQGDGDRRRRRSPSVGMMMSQFTRSAEVQAELELSKETVEELETALDAARPDFSTLREMSAENRRVLFTQLNSDIQEVLEKTLPEAPFQRLRQLALQHVGPAALREPIVVAELGLSDEQQVSINGQIEAHESKVRAALEGGQEDAVEQLTTDVAGSLMAVLTAEQLEKWQAFLGQPTELDLDDIAQQQRQFGGARGGSSGFGSGEAPGPGNDRPQRPPLDEPADAEAPSVPPGA